MINITEVKAQKLESLLEMARELEMSHIHRLPKNDLVVAILKQHAKHSGEIFGEGTLEITSDGYGFLRSSEDSYQPGSCDIYISVNQIRKLHLKTGDMIKTSLRPPRSNEKFFSSLRIEKINDQLLSGLKFNPTFEALTPIHPQKRLQLERGNGSKEDIAARIIDLFCPIGKGQRGLIVSPPKSGKTMILQNIANSISTNNPECHLIVLLVDERPEEVTEMQRTVDGEVISSTFDEPATRHVQVAEIVLGKAKRLAENKKDVVVLLDSITRLARAYNTTAPTSGKVLTGGVDSTALQKPKRFFGAARQIEGGGSITIIATALVDTGSKMDEVIFQEFKGTGNMELRLERRLAERRTFPAIDVAQSGTRREELLTKPDELKMIWVLRKLLNPMDQVEALELILDKLSLCKTNEQFFESMKNNTSKRVSQSHSSNNHATSANQNTSTH